MDTGFLRPACELQKAQDTVLFGDLSRKLYKNEKKWTDSWGEGLSLEAANTGGIFSHTEGTIMRYQDGADPVWQFKNPSL